MNDELREAAERLRRMETGVGLREVYEYYGDMPGDELDKWMIDRALVAKAYLAEHPEDDGKAVTPQWLKKLHGAEVGFGGWPRIGPIQWDQIGLSAVVSTLQGTWPLPTRGHVRRLAVALGVELKEKPCQ